MEYKDLRVAFTNKVIEQSYKNKEDQEVIYTVIDKDTKEVKFRTNSKKSAQNKCRQLYYNYREQRQFIIKKA